MKKIFAMIISILFLATISFAVVGCSKKEEPKPAETAAPAAPATPEAAPEAPATPEAAPEAPETK
ncbi:MAG: hypothetical protein K0B01_11530 [Syntrophobacterales bacterium]|nr:hypothetical protein [Syntrophobacterales bacterium]